MLRAHMAMLDRLEAAKALTLFEATVAASGRVMKDGDQSGYLGELRRRAAGVERTKPAKATPARMAAMGIAVITEPGVHPGWDALEQAEEVKG